MAQCKNMVPLAISIALFVTCAQGASLVNFLSTETETSSLYAQVSNTNYGVEPTWNQNGPFTVFAPNNAAWTQATTAKMVNDLISAAATDPSGIRSVLNGHIAYGMKSTADLTDGVTMQTISGQTLTIYKTSSGAIYVDNMLVVGGDNTVSINGVNSVVHIVNAVNFPPASRNLVQALQAVPESYSTLSSNIKTANIQDTLSTGTYTLFSPTNVAFTNAATFTSIYSSSAQLGVILTGHTVQGIIDVANLGNNSQLVTVEGGKVNVMKTSAGVVYINNALLGSMSTATNGRYYEVNAVLKPRVYQDIVATYNSDPAKFTTLSAVIVGASMTSTLSQLSATASTKYTMFAAVDSAWAALGYSSTVLPGGVTTSINADYVKATAMSGERKSSLLRNGDVLTMLNGDKVEVYISGSDIYIGNAKVTSVDVTATNGIIHYVDAVIIPSARRNLLQALQAKPSTYSTLVSAISAAGLDATFTGGTAYTLLGPTNAAFAQMQTTVDQLLYKASYGDKTPLSTLLRYHLLPNSVSSTTLFSSSSHTAASVQGDQIKFSTEQVVADGKTNSVNYADGAKVSAADVSAVNGVLHTLDELILPYSMRTVYQWLYSERQMFKTQRNFLAVQKAPKAGVTVADLLKNESVQHTFFAFSEATLAASSSAKEEISRLIASATTVDKNSEWFKKYGKSYGEYFVAQYVQQATLGSQSTLASMSTGATLPTLCVSKGCVPSLEFTSVGGTLYVNNIPLSSTMMSGTNGNIYILSDNILRPGDARNIYQRIRSMPATMSSLLSKIMATSFNTQISCEPVDTCILAASGLKFTMFAPTNAGFTKADLYGAPFTSAGGLDSNTDNLRKLLQYHLVSGQLNATELTAQALAKQASGERYALDTVFGTTLEVYVDPAGAVFVNNMKVIGTDIECTNGLIHYTDDVAIQPPVRNSLQQLQASPATYSTLLSAISAATMQTSLVDGTTIANGYTLFAPTNDAFKVVLAQVQTYLSEAEAGTKTNLVKLLNYHIYTTSRLIAPDSFTDATTIGMLEGNSANVKKIGSEVYVDIANVDNQAQFAATNAQVSKVTSVLFPPDLRNVAEVAMAQTKNFYTFGTALQSAALIATLSTLTKYTVLAPSDAAFKDPKVSAVVNAAIGSSDKSQLRKLLTYHVLLGEKKTTADFSSTSAIWPAQSGVGMGTLYTGNNVTVWQVSSTVGAAEQNGQGKYAVNLARNYGWCAEPNSKSGANTPWPGVTHQDYFGTVLETASCTIGTADSFGVPLTGTNGAMHPIDRVLLPPDMRSIYQVSAQEPSKYTVMANLIEQAGLTSTLNDAASGTTYTMFFVMDNTIETAKQGAYDTTASRFADILDFAYCLTLPQVALATTTANSKGDPACWPSKTRGNPKLNDFVKYQVVKGTIYSSQLSNSSVITLNGQTINVCVNCNGKTYINDAEVLMANIPATNGVVHVISKLLQPTSTKDAKTALSSNPRVYRTMQTGMSTCGLLDQLSLSADNSADATFSGINMVTLFVPTNAAFKAAGITIGTTCSDSLKYQLAYSVLPKSYSMEKLTSGSSLETLMAKITTHPLFGQGSGRRRLLSYYNQSVNVNIWQPPGTLDLYVDNARIDLKVGAMSVLNGFVYQIDKVLVPPNQRNVYQWADATPSLFKELTGAIDIAGLAEVLAGTGPFTVFAPTNEAFAAAAADSPGGMLGVTALTKLANQGNKTLLQDLLMNHVVYGIWPWPLKAGTMMRSVSGLQIVIRIEGDKYYANSAEIVSSDRFTSSGTTRSIVATNGLVYGVGSVLRNKLPIPKSAIKPPDLDRIPQGMCPEYAAVLLPGKVSAPEDRADGAGFATVKIDAKKTQMVVTVSTDSPLATSPGGMSFGAEATGIVIRGPGGLGFQFKDVSKQRIYTETFAVSSAILKDMDDGKLYVEVINPSGKAIQGSFSRQACYEAQMYRSEPTTQTEQGYAMAMVNPAMTEVLFQFQMKTDYAKTYSAIELMGQASSPNLRVNQPPTGSGALEYTFFSTASDMKDLNYSRPGYVVTDEMAKKAGSSLKEWVHGLKIGAYYLSFRSATSTASGYFYPAMPCPSLTAFALNRYLTYKTAGSDLVVLSQARLDSYERSVLISVKKIRSGPITGLEVRGPADVGTDNTRVVLELGEMPANTTFIQKRFFLTAMDVFNFQSGRLYLLVKTAKVPEGEARGQFQMGTCLLNHGVGDDGNVAYGQTQIAAKNTGPPTYADYPAFTNQFATNYSSTAFSGARNTASLTNIPLIAMNGLTSLGSPTVLPGQAIPPVKLATPGGTQSLPLMGTTLSLSQQAHDLLVLGKGAVTFPGLTASMKVVESVVQIKVIADPSKYVVEEGDTLESIAKAKGFTSWVPLQMVNRLTRPYGLIVGQVLDLCYKHKVMSGESVFNIAKKYGLTSIDELLPMNPQLFDSQFIYEGQEVCVMPALRRIMCGYQGKYTIGMA